MKHVKEALKRVLNRRGLYTAHQVHQAVGPVASAVADPAGWRKLLPYLRVHGETCARLLRLDAPARGRLIDLFVKVYALAERAVQNPHAGSVGGVPPPNPHLGGAVAPPSPHAGSVGGVPPPNPHLGGAVAPPSPHAAWTHLDDLLELWKHQPPEYFQALAAYPRPLRRDALRAAANELVRQLAFAEAQKRSRVRELYLAELFAGIEEVAVPLGAINELTGHANPADLLYVAAMARHRSARRLLEIGTYLGRTTYHLTFAHPDALVTTVNLPPEADPRHGPYLGAYFRGTDKACQIRQLLCDSRTMDTAPYRGQMDFVFVDADHGKEAVAQDTARAFEALAPGGMIVWHDYAAKSPGVYEFMEEFTQTQPVFRVKKTCLLVYLDGVAVDDFVPHPLRATLERAELGDDA